MNCLPPFWQLWPTLNLTPSTQCKHCTTFIKNKTNKHQSLACLCLGLYLEWNIFCVCWGRGLGGDDSEKWWMGELKTFYLQIPLPKDPFFPFSGPQKTVSFPPFRKVLCAISISLIPHGLRHIPGSSVHGWVSSAILRDRGIYPSSCLSIDAIHPHLSYSGPSSWHKQPGV